MTTALRSVTFVDLRAQLRAIRSEVDVAIARVMDRGTFVLGHEVERFEEEYAAYCGATDAVGVDSGTSALELILRALGIGPSDEVITISTSFVASALAVLHVGGTPVFVDPDARTRTMSAEGASHAVTSRTRVLLPVHLYGQPTNMTPILALAHRHGLAVVEDACQAHGARYRGARTGSLARAAAFSFYPSKNLGALGDGGMVVTSDRALADEVRLLRNYGQAVKNRSMSAGYNKRLDEIHAAVLRVKLRHLDRWNAARANLATMYTELLGPVDGIVTPAGLPGSQSVWHLYVVNVAHRDHVRRHLAAEGIATGVHYPIAIHRQPVFHHLGYAPGSLPVSEHHAATNLSLPMYPELEPVAVERVADALRRTVTRRVYRGEES